MLKIFYVAIIIILLHGCMKKDDFVQPYPEISDIEENDSFDQSVLINTLPLPVTGYFNEKTGIVDRDFYRVILHEKSGAFRFTLTAVPGVNSVVSIYNLNRELLFSLNERSIGEAEVAWRYYSHHKEFYVEIASITGSNPVVPYIFTLIPEKSDNTVELEPNNTGDQATLIQISSTLKGYIVPGDDVDYFKLIPEYGGRGDFRIKLESLSSVDMTMEIMNVVTGEVVLINDGTSGTSEVSHPFGSEKGDYLIKLTGELTDTGKEPLYYITVEPLHRDVDGKEIYYEREFNNTIETATALIAGEEMSGVISNNDTDYFMFDILDDNGTFNLSVEGLNLRNASVEIVRGDGELVYKPSGTSNIAYRGMTRGRYYVKLHSTDPGNIRYRLFYGLYQG